MTPYGEAALTNNADLVRAAAVGGRNNALNKAAFRSGQLVPAGHLDVDDIVTVLIAAALMVGIDEREANRTIRSGINAGVSRPRTVRPTITSRTSALAEVEVIATVLARTPYGGHRGNRVVCAVEAALGIARERGGPVGLALGTRRMAIAMGKSSHGYVQRAILNAVEDGWLRKDRAGTSGHSAVYTLKVPADLLRSESAQGIDMQSGLVTTTTNTVTSDQESSRSEYTLNPTLGSHRTHIEKGGLNINSDLVRSKRSGRITGKRIVALLLTKDWWTQADLGRALGMASSTVWRCVGPEGHLTKLGVVVRNERGAVALNPDLDAQSFDQLAKIVGVSGALNRQRARYRRQFQDEGYLTSDNRWFDAATGEVRGEATWLLDDQGNHCDD